MRKHSSCCFHNKQIIMPKNLFGSTSNFPENKIDTSIFEQKPFWRNNYRGSIIEEDININHYWIKNLPDPISFGEAALKIFWIICLAILA